jgi:DNA repair protein RecN (Recombination protein N)
MLTELSIENFAIIDRLLVRFDSGFTVLTGETGAGKSIIIDALQAALGSRTSPDTVREGANAAVAEAVFEGSVIADPALSALLGENGIQPDEGLILRREINATGRGSARVNGRAVPLATLAAIGDLLVDIHGQSDHLLILRRDRQLDVLDRFGGLTEMRNGVGGAVREYLRLRRYLEELSAGQREAERRLDQLRFQVQEIEVAGIRVDEEPELESELHRLANAERLMQLSEAAYQALHAQSGSAVDALGSAESAGRDLAAIDSSLQTLSERLEAARIEVEDLAQELRVYRDSVEADPQRLDEVEGRLDLLTRLKRKYGDSLTEVLDFGAKARTEMEEVENLDERIGEAQRDLADAEQSAGSLAAELSAARRSAARELSEATQQALQGLGLKGTSFEARIGQAFDSNGLPLPDGKRYGFTAAGVDTVTYLVSFNPGEPPRPLEKVASGGETSRFLLALKSVLAAADRTPTLVFDEVDVGVGGRHGMVVGERLKELAQTHQVLSISHLPQVAALADHHLSVLKAIGAGRTGVAVRRLDPSERVSEIAEMMSGSGSEAARQNALELLEAARRNT